jgi:hypothetical protein
MTVGGAPFGDSSRCDWDQFLEQITYWAREVRYELDTPDFWAELKNSARVLAELDDELADNRPFTQGERTQIAQGLDEVKEHVSATYHPAPEQMAVIERGVEELKEATERVNRKDWGLMFQGIILGWVVDAFVPPEAVHGILMVLLYGIAHIAGGGPPAIPPLA